MDSGEAAEWAAAHAENVGRPGRSAKIQNDVARSPAEGEGRSEVPAGELPYPLGHAGAAELELGKEYGMGAGRKNVVVGLLGLAAMMLSPYVEACGCRFGFPVYYMGAHN